MIEVSKYDDNTYVAVMDIQTFESYGLSVDFLDGGSSGVENLLTEIMDMIAESFGVFKAEVCGVGIMVDKGMNKVSISIGDEEPNVEILDEYLDNFGDEDYEDEYEGSFMTTDEKPTFGASPVSAPAVREVFDYSQGIVAELNDIEDVISLAKTLKLDKKDNVTLYLDENEKNKYYVIIDKTFKLKDLIEENITEDDDEDVADSIEFEIGKEIFVEYEFLRSYFEENNLTSHKSKGYMEEYCKVLIQDKAFVDLKKFFK